MKKSIPAYPHSAARVLATVFRLPAAAELDATLTACAKSDLCTAPFDLERVRFCGEQLAVAPSVLWPKPRTSQLFRYLTEYPDDVHLVVDAVKPGKDGLYFCRLSQDREIAIKWISRMTNPSLILNQAGGEIIIAAPVAAFAA
jgi:hypothetical protein